MDAFGVALLVFACTLRTYSTLWWWGRIYPGYPFIFAGSQLVMIIGGLGLLLIGRLSWRRSTCSRAGAHNNGMHPTRDTLPVKFLLECRLNHECHDLH